MIRNPNQVLLVPFGSHPDPMGGAPWFAIEDDWVYPAEGHPFGASAIPWFQILSDYLYTSNWHPSGPRAGAWFRSDGELIWVELGNPEWRGTPEIWYRIEKAGASGERTSIFGPRPSHPVQNPPISITHRNISHEGDTNGFLFDSNAGRVSPVISTERQIVSLYEELRRLMKDHNLFGSATRIRGRYPPRRVSREFHEICLHLMHSIQQRAPRLEGQVLILDATRTEQLNDRLLRHALAFSETTLLITPELRGEIWGTGGDSVDYWIPQSFITTIGQYWHLVRDGFILPLPQKIQSAGLGENAVYAEVTPMMLRGDALHYASDTTGDRDLVVATRGRVLLPSLGRMRVNSILKMRDAEHAAFKRFHAALRSLIRSEGLQGDLDSLITAVRHTDEMVNELNDRIKSHRPVGMGAALAVGAGIAALSQPIDSKWIAAVLTGIGITGLRFFSDTYQQLTTLSRDPFFFPWLLAHPRALRPA
jgi:hypothetical protein